MCAGFAEHFARANDGPHRENGLHQLPAQHRVRWALAISQNLTQSSYDVFFDYQGIASGDFEQVILENIRARAHFLVLLTPQPWSASTNPVTGYDARLRPRWNIDGTLCRSCWRASTLRRLRLPST